MYADIKQLTTAAVFPPRNMKNRRNKSKGRSVGVGGDGKNEGPALFPGSSGSRQLGRGKGQMNQRCVIKRLGTYVDVCLFS